MSMAKRESDIATSYNRGVDSKNGSYFSSNKIGQCNIVISQTSTKSSSALVWKGFKPVPNQANKL